MRFARHARICHGPLDAAPVAGMLLLLMVLMMLGSLVYTPGVLVDLTQPVTAATSNAVIAVTASNVVFAQKSYKAEEMGQLRADMKALPGNARYQVKMEPGADASLGRQVSNLFQIALPEGKNMAGTDNATVVVAVNFRGQCFYQNRLVQDAELESELAGRLKIAARDSRKLTMILLLDKAAENEVQARLFELARRAGITEVLLAERPPMFGGRP